MSEQLFERAVREWLEDGSDRTPQPAINAVLLAVKTTPQVRAPWSPWRFTYMPSYMRLAAAIAVVAIVGAGAWMYFAGPGGPGRPAATPTPTPVPTASPPTPTASPTPRPVSMEVQGDAASWTAAVPPGWSPGSATYLTPNQGPAGPSGIAVAATGAVHVPSDPCDGVGKVSDAESPADVVAALVAREDLAVSSPIPTTLGGYAGLQVDVQLPADISGCDLYIVFAEPDGSGFYAQGPSNRLRIWVVDVDGRPIVVFVESFAATPAADLAAAQQILDSIVITP